MRRILTTGRVIVIGLAVMLAACGPSTGSPPALRSGEPPTTRIPIIVDADFDLSDIAAILILLRDPTVEVRAITITGTGLVHCQAGRLVTRYLIDELGSSDIPFGCGREQGGDDAHQFPDEWRVRADEAFGLNIPPQAEAGVPRDAVAVIAAAVDSSPSAPTIVALGPLTNLEDAFAADATLADRVAGIHAMLGTVDAPGNVFVNGLDGSDPLEWNAYADPSAVAAVFATDVPISIDGVHPRAAAEHLGRHGIYVWDGDFYATGLIERLGKAETGGVLRLGLVHYNTDEEVDRALEAVEGIATAARA